MKIVHLVILTLSPTKSTAPSPRAATVPPTLHRFPPRPRPHSFRASRSVDIQHKTAAIRSLQSASSSVIPRRTFISDIPTYCTASMNERAIATKLCEAGKRAVEAHSGRQYPPQAVEQILRLHEDSEEVLLDELRFQGELIFGSFLGHQFALAVPSPLTADNIQKVSTRFVRKSTFFFDFRVGSPGLSLLASQYWCRIRTSRSPPAIHIQRSRRSARQGWPGGPVQGVV
ncbi:hypothetical protein DFH09DRAFT_459058 [Mycena vulgaris]|nr:hypothetical protein DFH09DRAFT_459058 [Mycena vulgaris]